ncbi:MAG: hypothetical protein ACYC1U_06070 [Candidatus Aquicultorales bacterium]
MTRRKIIAAVTTLAMLTAALPAMAAGETANQGNAAQAPGLKEKKAQVLDRARELKMEKLRKRGLQMVDKRIGRLEKELIRVRSLKKISEEERAALVEEIQGALDELSILRGRIERETDAQALISEVKSIISNFRVYAVVLPKAKALEAAERANWGAQRFDTLAGKIEERIAEAEAAGEDVTALQELLEQFKAELESAKANIAEAREAFKSMLIIDPKAATMSLKEGKAELKEARQDFKDAIGILKQIKEEFKKIKDEAQDGSTEDSPTVE